MKFFLRFISPVKNYPPCLHANPAAAVARVHVVSVLTRSRPARCIQPVKGLRCGFGVSLASSALRRVFVAARRKRVTVLASPTQPLDGVCEAILQKAVMDAWEKKANKARIDDVHNYLTNEDVNQAFADKPTIIARLAELAMLLDTYCTWGPDGEYFNADTPTLDGETRFAVLELLSLEDKPKLLSAILFSLILAIQEKMYHSPRDLKKVCIIDEAWRLLGGSNPHAARFIETGYRTVRRHRGAFITITQGIKDFSASKEAEAAWNNSSTKITLLQDAKAFKQYLADNPDQFSDMEKEVIRGFQPALQTGYSSLLINAGEYSSFHRLFVDPVRRLIHYMTESGLTRAWPSGVPLTTSAPW